ncbi:MAG: DUF3240 family protein [Thiohalobacteraceae bacterium]|nr:DUF3240 family protein [Gammaproteobacteria bacterium]
MQSCLLALAVSPSMEHAMVDWLLENETVGGFTSLSIHGHGTSLHSLSTAEQVAGRKGQILFQLYLPVAAAREVVAALRREFQGSGMHYWITPLLEAGHLD